MRSFPMKIFRMGGTEPESNHIVKIDCMIDERHMQ